MFTLSKRTHWIPGNVLCTSRPIMKRFPIGSSLTSIAATPWVWPPKNYWAVSWHSAFLCLRGQFFIRYCRSFLVVGPASSRCSLLQEGLHCCSSYGWQVVPWFAFHSDTAEVCVGGSAELGTSDCHRVHHSALPVTRTSYQVIRIIYWVSLLLCWPSYHV